MNSHISSRLGWVVAAAVVLLAWLAPLGDLNPPAGSVSASMKPLSDIEPGTPVTSKYLNSDADALFVIDKPGHYYLVGNITGPAGKRAIEIATDNISLDLSGFVIEGVAGSLEGIATRPGVLCRDLVIRNGVLSGWSSGVSVSADGFVAENLALRNCVTYGLRNSAESGTGASRITGCHFEENDVGLSLQSPASLVESCVARSNRGGILATGERALVRDCVVTDSIELGIQLNRGECTRCVVTGGSVGILAGSGTRVSGCSISGPSNIGISASSRCTIIDNSLDLNTTGILASSDSRIEANTLFSGTNGIVTAFGGNTVVGNRLRGITTPFTLLGTNIVGTIVGTSAALNAAGNGLVNISF